MNAISQDPGQREAKAKYPAMDRVRREQAIAHAALNVLERSLATGEDLEDAAREFIRGQDPRQPGGINQAGREITFTWSYDYGELPEILAKAREYEQETRP